MLTKKKKTDEAACSETAIKFSMDSLCPTFFSLKYAPFTLCDVEGSFSMFKNVQSDKRMSLNKDNLEKLVMHCLKKNK